MHIQQHPQFDPQVGSEEGKVYVDFTPTFCEVERWFMIDLKFDKCKSVI